MMLIAGLLLCVTALLSLLGIYEFLPPSWFSTSMTMLIVFAMGILNAANKLCPESTFGPATVMTGNVTKATLDFYQGFFSRERSAAKKVTFMQTLVLIMGFFIGCLAGAILGSKYGLGVVVVPGLLIVVYYACIFRKNQK